MADPAVAVCALTARLRRRVIRSSTSVDALDQEIGAWFDGHRDERYATFARHFAVLETVLARMLRRLRDELSRTPAEMGEAYAHCRRVDRGLSTLRRLFAWYAEKYDQRGNHCSRVLLAADEFARSCWTEGFVAAGRQPPTGPLCFVDNRTDAFAARRCEVPTELRPGVDDPVREFVDQLPIPVIALPEAALRESWWLVLAAHETGHHILLDLDLAQPVRAALRATVAPALLADWQRWHQELFADLYSVLMVGPAAAWAIDELQYGPRAQLLCSRGGYPAPLVRLAFLAEVTRALDGAVPDLADPADDPSIEPHLAVLPQVVAALLDVPLGRRTLRSLATDEAVRLDRRVRSWSASLLRPDPLFAHLNVRQAPRLLVAAAVHRYQAIASTGTDARLAGLHDALLNALPHSGEPGVLAPPGTPRGIDALADRLGEQLMERAAEGEPA